MTENLTKETFIEKVFDFENNKDWLFKGDKPCIIDWHAENWCQPCQTIGPVLEELSETYPEINIYKIDIDDQQELANVFGIRSIPSLLFVPLVGDPQMVGGALPKDKLIETIENVLL